MKIKKIKREADLRTLRSINIALDLEHSDRLAGYVPTRKAVNLSEELLSAVLGEGDKRAFAISAPYGSGKSSAVLFWCQLIESCKKSAAFKATLEEFKRKSKELEINESVFFKLDRKKLNGLAVPVVGFEGGSVSGYVLDAIESSLLRHGLSSLATKVSKLPRTFESLRQTLLNLTNGSFDSVYIAWDEFGRVLEHAAIEGEGKVLLEVQMIAELSARTINSNPIVFSIVMHQSFSRYSAALPNYIRTEWAKIEGRFNQINYIEDSKEIYELIGQVVSRKFGAPEESRAEFRRLATECHNVGLFKDFNLDALTEVLWSSAPLSPISLYLLPKISARVAQNERTMFSFLWSNENNALPSTKLTWVTPEDIFEYFADLMRADTSVGGAHRIWSEAQVALKKCDSEAEEKFVKALACIKIGSSSGSLFGTKQVSEIAFGGNPNIGRTPIEKIIKSLEDKKAIFYKRLTGEYTVWQGSDVDIRSAVQEQKDRIFESLELNSVLSKEFPPPFRFPQRHNDLNCIRRFFDGRYLNLSDLRIFADKESCSNDSLDGRIFYLLAETKEEIVEATKLAKEFQESGVIFAIPRATLKIREGLAEVEALHSLLADPDFRKQDPLVEQELKLLTDESEQHVKSQISKLINPSSDGPKFVWKGQLYDEVNTMGDLKRLLSKVCDKLYPLTPIINNELINKNEPSPQIVNARKSIVRGIMEGYGSEHFGLKGYGPDVSVCRAVFVATGIYRKKGKDWILSDNGEQLTDKGLGSVWQKFIDIWSVPSDEPKNLKSIIDTVQSAPIGLRKGVIPLMLAASFKRSGSQAQIFEDGIFVTEFKPETFERMLRSPQAFVVNVPKLSKDFVALLDGVIEVFGHEKRTNTGDRVRNATQCLMAWLKDLPQISKERGMISPEIDELVLTLFEARDPMRLFSQSLQTVFKLKSHSTVLAKLKELKIQIENIEKLYFNKARHALLKTLRANEKGNVNEVCKDWVSSLPGIQLDEFRKRYMVDRRAAGLISRIDQAYSTEKLVILSLAELLADKPLKFWNSNSFAVFEVNLLQVVKWVEDIADDVDFEMVTKNDPSANGKLAGTWIEKRVRSHFERVVQRLGKAEARKIVDNVLESLGDL